MSKKKGPFKEPEENVWIPFILVFVLFLGFIAMLWWIHEYEAEGHRNAPFSKEYRIRRGMPVK